jgi:hypothetical protein
LNDGARWDSYDALESWKIGDRRRGPLPRFLLSWRVWLRAQALRQSGRATRRALCWLGQALKTAETDGFTRLQLRSNLDATVEQSFPILNPGTGMKPRPQQPAILLHSAVSGRACGGLFFFSISSE